MFFLNLEWFRTLQNAIHNPVLEGNIDIIIY